MLKVLLFLTASVLALASEAYISSEGRFSAKFPSKEVSQKVEQSAGSDIYMFLCIHEGVVYLVGYSDFNIQALTDKDRDEASKAAAEGFMESVDIKGGIKKVKQSGFSAYEGRGANSDKSLTTVYRSFMKGDRLYQVGILSSTGKLPSGKQVKSYFNDFKVF